jgi:hypothetical protein
VELLDHRPAAGADPRQPRHGHAHQADVAHPAPSFVAAVAGIPEPLAEYTMLTISPRTGPRSPRALSKAGHQRESSRTVPGADVRWLAMRADDARD